MKSMKSVLGVVVVVPLLFGGLAACGGSDSGSTTTETTTAATPAETTEPTTEATAESSEGMDEGGSAVDAYCQKVDEYAAEAKKLIDDPTSVNASELQAKAQELQDTASQLTQELIDDPSKAAKVQECTTKLQEVLAG